MARRDRRTTHGNRWRRPLHRASRPCRYPRRIRDAAEIWFWTGMDRKLRKLAGSAVDTIRGYRDLSAAIDRVIDSLGRREMWP